VSVCQKTNSCAEATQQTGSSCGIR